MPLHLIPPGRRKGNRYYIARGSVGGIVREFNTYETDERAARRRAEALENASKTSRRRGLSSPEKGGTDASLTFADAAELYIGFRNPSQADRQRIAKVRTAIGTLQVSSIRPADLHNLAIRLYPDATAATRNRNVLRPALTILHHASEAGLCKWIRVKLFKEARPVTRALTPEAAAALIDAAEPGPQRRLLVWLFFQGTRISATLRLNWSHIDLRSGTVTMWNAKGDRWETFPLHEMTLQELRGQPGKPDERVFPWSHRWNLRTWLPALCEEVGVDFTPHMGRHTLGTMMAANGETLRAIMAALGHTTASSSIRYQGADIEMVRAATSRVTLPLKAKKS